MDGTSKVLTKVDLPEYWASKWDGTPWQAFCRKGSGGGPVPEPGTMSLTGDCLRTALWTPQARHLRTGTPGFRD